MRLFKKFFFAASIALISASSASAESNNDISTATENGLRYLESVQTEYGEFPTTYTRNIPEPGRSLTASYSSNLFTTTLLSDALHAIKNSRVERIQKKIVSYVQSQLVNQNGLWSFMTTHNPDPVYPNTTYDLDDTAMASIVLQQQGSTFPDNRKILRANKNKDGVFLTFIVPTTAFNDVDCGVNADVLYYLKENDPQVCHYLNEQVRLGTKCGYYYTRMDAYYLIANAYGSGICCLKPSIVTITNYAIAQFNPNDGSVGNSPFKTAVALNALLASGYHGPLIEQAKRYLLKTQSTSNGSWSADDFWIWASPVDEGRSSSSALTTAYVLKALNTIASQSAVGFDQEPVSSRCK